MVKRLLSAIAFAAVAFTASAVKVGDLVYTNHARFSITGENLVTNGDFKSEFAGWNSINEATIDETFQINLGGGTFADQNSLAAKASSKNGIYQAIPVEQAGYYVLSMDIRNELAPGFTDFSSNSGSYMVNVATAGDFFSAGQNYINFIYNTDGTPNGLTDRKELSYGQNEVAVSTEYTTVNFALNLEQEGYLIVEIAAMAEGAEVCNVELRKAVPAYDDRRAQSRAQLAETILYAYEWDSSVHAYISNLKDAIAKLNAAIEAKDGIETAENNLNSTLNLFLGENVDEMLQFWGTGNNAADWMKWTGKFNKIKNDNPGNPYWTWTTDRWCHKTQSANAPIGVEWQTGQSATWDNIATLTHDLEAGTYMFGFTGYGSRCSLNKADWARSGALECAEIYFIVNGDTLNWEPFILHPTIEKDYIVSFTLEEDVKDATIAFTCNTNAGSGAGFDTKFNSPFLYKVYTGEGYTEEEKAYLNDVNVQLTEAKNRIDAAKDTYENDATRPWVKDELKAGIDQMEAKYNEYAALSEDEILEDWLYEDKKLADTIYNNVGKPMKDTYLADYNNKNQPLVDLIAEVEAAKKLNVAALYSGCDHATFVEAIVKALGKHMAYMKESYSQENYDAVVAYKAELVAAEEAFKTSQAEKTIIDIDFGTQENPAQIQSEEPAVEGETTKYYVDGAAGRMYLSAVATAPTGGTQFQLGYNDVDSLGMLRVGNAEATVDFSSLEVGDKDVIKFAFDYYHGNLVGKYSGVFIKGAEDAIIDGYYVDSYNSVMSTADGENTFGWSDMGTKIAGVGSSSASNAKIAETSQNLTHYEIIYDFSKGIKYMTIDNKKKGQHTSDELPLTADQAPKMFLLKSNYNNSDRRCWFDNFKVTLTSAKEYVGPTDKEYEEMATGVTEAKGENAVEKANRVVADQNGIYILKANGEKVALSGAAK